MSGQELAEGLGLKTFDFALPLEWFQQACDLAGKNVSGHVVWCYDAIDGNRCTYGYPVALTELGRATLGMLAQGVK